MRNFLIHLGCLKMQSPDAELRSKICSDGEPVSQKAPGRRGVIGVNGRLLSASASPPVSVTASSTGRSLPLLLLTDASGATPASIGNKHSTTVDCTFGLAQGKGVLLEHDNMQ